MPQIETKNEKVQKLVGLHLYHDPLSSCAMRVRMVLAEKKLPWKRHVINFAKMEHATPEYQSINPNGLVPTLIHDGRTYIKSIDIIRISGWTRGGAIAPSRRCKRAGRLQEFNGFSRRRIKTLTHEFLFRGSGRYLGEQDQKKFATAHHNAWLVDFKRSFAALDDKWLAKVAAALVEMNMHFRDLDRRLATNEWLIDGSFTLADVAWTPQVHRMSLMEWPMVSYLHLSRWYAQLQKRPSFQEAVVDCEPAGAGATFASYAAQRRSEGTSLADMLNKSAA